MALVVLDVDVGDTPVLETLYLVLGLDPFAVEDKGVVQPAASKSLDMHTGLEFFEGDLLDHGKLGRTVGVMVSGQIDDSTASSIRQGPAGSKKVASSSQGQSKMRGPMGSAHCYRPKVFPCRIKVGMARYLSWARFFGVRGATSKRGMIFSFCLASCGAEKKEVATHRLRAERNPCLKPFSGTLEDLRQSGL